MDKKKKDWEEKLLFLIRSFYENDDSAYKISMKNGVGYVNPELISFIRQLLEEQKKELKEKVESLCNPFEKDWDYPYDQAICEVIQILLGY